MYKPQPPYTSQQKKEKRKKVPRKNTEEGTSCIVVQLSSYFEHFHLYFSLSRMSYSVHSTALIGSHSTNNETERWNNQLTKLCENRHSAIWNLIRKMAMGIFPDEAELV